MIVIMNLLYLLHIIVTVEVIKTPFNDLVLVVFPQKFSVYK